MSNAFDSTNYPITEPDELVVGDRWMWKRTDLGTDYPPASYSLKYSLRKDVATPTPEIEITASGSGSEFLIEVASATTAGYTSGRYRWQAYVTRTSDSQRIKIASGVVQIKANSDADASTDARTHARKCLDSIESALEAFAGDTVQTYTITTGTGSRTVTKRNVNDLLKLRDDYRAAVKAEETLASGKPSNKLLMRL